MFQDPTMASLRLYLILRMESTCSLQLIETIIEKTFELRGMPAFFNPDDDFGSFRWDSVECERRSRTIY